MKIKLYWLFISCDQKSLRNGNKNKKCVQGNKFKLRCHRVRKRQITIWAKIIAYPKIFLQNI